MCVLIWKESIKTDAVLPLWRFSSETDKSIFSFRFPEKYRNGFMPLFRIPWMKHFFRSARIIFRWPTERRIIFEPRAGWIQSNGSRIKHVDMFTRTSLQKIVMGTQPVALSTSVILQLNGSILTTKRWHHASTTRLAPRSKCWAGGNRAFPKKKTSFFEWQ